MTTDHEYEQLISSLADQIGEPVCGKPGIEQIPQLTMADVALICRTQEDVKDHLHDELDLAALAPDLQDKDVCQIGLRFASALERACRATIAYDILCEIESRERDAQIEAEDRRWQRYRVLEAQ